MDNKKKAALLGLDLYMSNAVFPLINLEKEPENVDYLTQAVRTLTEGVKKLTELEEKYGSFKEIDESKERLEIYLSNIKDTLKKLGEEVEEEDESFFFGIPEENKYYKKYLKYKKKYLELRK